MSKRFLKSSRPSLPLKKAPPLISVFSPQGRRREPPSGARNRYALRLAGHQSPRQIVRDGTAWLLWGSACNYIVESECMERAYRLRPPFLFLIAVSLCACRRSNEEYYFYSTFERITSGEVPIRVMAEIL